MHAESIGVTALSRVCPVLEGSGRDADPCQRQLLGPFVRAKSKHQGSRVGQKIHRKPTMLPWMLLLVLAVIGAGTLMETTATSLIWPEQIGQELLIN